MTVDGHVLRYDEIVCNSTYLCPVNIKYHYYVSLDTNNSTTVVSLLNFLNINVKIIICSEVKVLPNVSIQF